MRAFFAIDPPAQIKLAIESWREKALPTFLKMVPPANFHITLAFLGQVNDVQLESLIQQSEVLTLTPGFPLSLDNLGYWPKPKALWLGSHQIAKQHIQLTDLLTKISLRSAVVMQKKEYIPHLTLVRKCAENPPAALIEPTFSFDVEEFHLFESVSTTNGVIYKRRKTWRLAPIMAVTR
ncbi:MAG: 2'-5' RNA ligase [Paraglaciecola sp.]|jgi:2'-5' RNA ligase